MATSDVDPAATDLTPPRSGDDDLRDLAGGALVVFVGKMARVSRGAFIWVITLLCGADVQGLYSSAWAICSTLNKVARFGLLRGVVYFVTADRAAADGDQRQSASIAAGYLIAFAASAFVVAAQLWTADAIAAFYGKPIAEAIRIMAWTAPCIAISWVFTSATRALRIMRYEVYVRSVAGPLVLFVGGTAVGLLGGGLEAVAWVQLVMGVSNLLLAGWYFRRHFSLGATLAGVRRPTPWKAMARFSLPVALADVLYALLVQLDVLMLLLYVNEAVVGVYVLARRVASVVLKAPQAFDAIFSSVVSDLAARQRHDELGDRFVVVSRWILTVNLPVAVCLLVVGDSILQVYAGKLEEVAYFSLALQVLLVLCVGMTVQSVFAVAEPLLAMSGRPGLNFVNNALWLATNFGLNLWLIDVYGAVGAALGATLAMVLINLVRIGQVYAVRGFWPFHRALLKPLVAAILAAVPTWWLRDIGAGPVERALLPCLAFLTVYGGVLVLLRLEPEDRMLLERLRRRLTRWRERRRGD